MKIFDYEEVKMNWDSFTYPIAVGTPVSIDGVLADNASAHGLIARTVFAKPDADETLKVMTGGIIDMEEIVAGYGQELSSAAVQALCGIHFYKNGVCIPSGGNGSSDDQKWHETTVTPLFSETVTTVTESGVNSAATFTYSTAINSDVLIMTFDGVEYTCPKNTAGPITYYGASYDPVSGDFDFTDFPFEIHSMVDETTGDIVNQIFTETAGEHTVTVVEKNTTYTNAFKNGVIANATMVVNFTGSVEGKYTTDKTNDDIINAFYSGTRIIGFVLGQNTYAGIPFNIERVNTLGQTPEISFYAIVRNVTTSVVYMYRISSFSDETGDGYEILDIRLEQPTPS